MNQSGTPSLPDFDLAPLRSFDPAVLSSENKLDRFVLTLALVFNDLKGIMWTLFQLDTGTPAAQNVVSPYSGQWVGMRLQFTRLALGMLNETLIAVQEALDDHVLEAAEWKECLESVPELSQSAWSDLLSLAAEKEAADPFRRFLIQARNNAAFHYGQAKVLMRGYQRFFFESDKTAFNEFAFMSLGPKMEQTRFYFADAAVQQALALMNPSSDTMKQVDNYLLAMSASLRFIVESYIRAKLPNDSL